MDADSRYLGEMPNLCDMTLVGSGTDTAEERYRTDRAQLRALQGRNEKRCQQSVDRPWNSEGDLESQRP
ncbi:hypothetical protein SAMN05421773_1033 [Streptomyces aidingensis]|uniref:Uncharacterized protein n=2 Tax=Streptomyces aidingensis TaxID=910347 RepID=A0A1I1IDD5_9ACTN|nr:hypothetical protein SAMN05421773_1033 [Streptomyces aidingensis]